MYSERAKRDFVPNYYRYEERRRWKDVVKAFVELGLTELEAKILIVLQKRNSLAVKDISASLDIHRQQIYPALTELQKAGLVTEQLGRPSQFKTSPIEELFALLLERKSKWISDMEMKTAEISRTFNGSLLKCSDRTDYSFELITGKERVKSALYEWGQTASTMDVVVKFDPLMQRNTEELETSGIRYSKNIEMRMVTDATETAIRSWHTSRKRQVRLLGYPVPIEMVIYDIKRAHLAVYPNRDVSAAAEVAVLTSNHPCFVGMLQNCFDVLWEASKEKPNSALGK